MAVEIERKFLVDRTRLPPLSNGVRIRQGYLCAQPDRTVRVRIGADNAWLTIKGATVGISRSEFEYPIPVADAEQLLALCRPRVLEKTRYRLIVGDHCWELDVFDGDNAGLIIAEVELTRADEPFGRPLWAAAEVSGDSRYFNARLIEHPWPQWRDSAAGESDGN